MKKIRWYAFLIAIGLGKASFAQQAIPETASDPAVEYARTITANDLLNHLRIIASDSLQGRGTGEAGQKMAADYIAYQFFDFGLQPPVSTAHGPATGYFQPFTLVRQQLETAQLVIGGQELAFPAEFMPLGLGTADHSFRAPLVFAGYGLETERYSDYKGIDVKDKVVLIFAGEPTDKRGRSLVTGEKRNYSWREHYREKEQLALQKGARQVFFIDEAGEIFGKNLSQYANYIRRSQLGFPIQREQSPNLSLFLSLPAAARALGISESDLLKQANRPVRKKKKLLSETPETDVHLVVSRTEVPVETENVLGLVEGTDKKDEVLVITAHYDHLGTQGEVVYNGANDDGSGTVAVLELAQAFAQAKAEGHGPRRSILFMTFTGEEKGLLGSKYYTDYPVFPLENTVANLNIDMIGRTDDLHKPANGTVPDYIYVIGSDKLSSELHAINEEANRKHAGIGLDYRYNAPNDPNRFYYRSDHYNFARHRIPVAFYFNGVHEDYHQPTDDVEKMDFGRAERVTRLIFHTAWELANREARIRVDSNKP